MKKVILFITALIFSCNWSFSQTNSTDIVLDNGNFYSKVFDYSSPAKDKHLKAKEWVAKMFGDYKSVLQFEDDENCKLIIKGFSNLVTENSSEAGGLVRTMEKPKMSYTLTIDSKDDKYRVKFENISFEIDKTFAVLGSSNHSTTTCDFLEFTKNDSIEYAKKIMEVSENIKRLEMINTSPMKKKEVAKHNEELKTQREFFLSETATQKKHIIRSKGRDILVRTTICELINSLSSSIEKNDNF